MMRNACFAQALSAILSVLTGCGSSGNTESQGGPTGSGGSSSGTTRGGGVAVSSGGNATGGVAVSSGGKATGGVGASSGGTAASGVAASGGGKATGGVAASSGGAATGGVAASSGGAATGGVTTVSSGTATDLDRLRALASKRIFFQHASVGGTITGVGLNPGDYTGSWGLNQIVQNNPGSGLSLLLNNATAPTNIPVGTFADFYDMNYNGNPNAKLTTFVSSVQGLCGTGPTCSGADIVMFMEDYGEIGQDSNFASCDSAQTDMAGVTPTTTIASWFANTYQPAIDSLQGAYPNLMILHATSSEYLTGNGYINYPIMAWNNLLRAAYGGSSYNAATNQSGNVFDTGYWESIGSDGTACTDSCSSNCMHTDWYSSTDYAHPNEAGADWLAEHLLAYLANLP